MPRGPSGERRPADTIGCAVTVAKIATGEIEDIRRPISGRTKSGFAGAHGRVAATTKKQRAEIARKAAQARWRKEA